MQNGGKGKKEKREDIAIVLLANAQRPIPSSLAKVKSGKCCIAITAAIIPTKIVAISCHSATPAKINILVAPIFWCLDSN